MASTRESADTPATTVEPYRQDHPVITRTWYLRRPGSKAYRNDLYIGAANKNYLTLTEAADHCNQQVKTCLRKRRRAEAGIFDTGKMKRKTRTLSEKQKQKRIADLKVEWMNWVTRWHACLMAGGTTAPDHCTEDRLSVMSMGPSSSFTTPLRSRSQEACNMFDPNGIGDDLIAAVWSKDDGVPEEIEEIEDDEPSEVSAEEQESIPKCSIEETESDEPNAISAEEEESEPKCSKESLQALETKRIAFLDSLPLRQKSITEIRWEAAALDQDDTRNDGASQQWSLQELLRSIERHITEDLTVEVEPLRLLSWSAASMM
jgi:hypothetical protein